MDKKVKPITFLIANRGRQKKFFETFDLAVNFKSNANVVVLEDTQALKQVVEQFSNTTNFRILFHADIGESGKEKQTRRLRICVDEVQAIPGCAHIEPFFITRSAEIEKLCLEKKKCFVKLNESNVMCGHTSKWSDKKFLKELKARSKNHVDDCLKSRLFIGSSSTEDGLKYLNAVKEVLDGDKTLTNNCEIHTWQDVFGNNNNSVTIEKLESALYNYKYSIFVFSPDDTIKMNGSDEEQKMPRDNVIFEYGLFMGKNGRSQTFFIVPQNWKGLRIISDLEGQNRFSYLEGGSIASAAVRTACNQIVEIINNLDEM